jgi:protein-tyrosine phosphatase
MPDNTDRELPSMTRPQVLFVCTGNTCRSPMAERRFRRLCRQRHVAATVKSAGLMATPGLPATAEAATVLARHGLTLADFRSSEVTADLLESATLIVAMTRRHAAALRRRFPAVAGRVCTLLELVDSQDDVADPIGGSLAVYERCLASMEPALAALLDRLEAEQQQPAHDSAAGTQPPPAATKGD